MPIQDSWAGAGTVPASKVTIRPELLRPAGDGMGRDLEFPKRSAKEFSAADRCRPLVELWVFATNFFKNPSMVGGLLPSSPFLVEEVLRHVHWDKAKVIVEYGPGVGSFTKKVLERMRPDARLIALEINPDFVKLLNANLPDPRFQLINRSASEIDTVLKELGAPHADYVISGIPFSVLPHALRDTIVRKTYAILRPQGSFLVYQVSGAVLPYLERVFGNVARDFELLNFFPMRMFYCAR